MSAFAHNGRAALALLPPAALLVVAGGSTLGGVTLFGVLLTYALDLQGWREASLAAMWGTLLSVAGGHFISSLLVFGFSPLGLAVAAGAAANAVLLGVWGSLNFKSLLRQFGQEMALLERALFAAAPFAAAPILAWGALALDGPGRAPYHLGLALAALHAVCGGPAPATVVPASAAVETAGDSAGGAVPLCARAVAALQCAASLALPPLFHAALVRHAPGAAGAAPGAAPLDLAVAAAVPAALLSLRPADEAFWWLAAPAPAGGRALPRADRAAGGWRAGAASFCARGFAAVAFGCFAVCRLLLGSLRHYVALSAPLDWLASAAAVGCALSALCLHAHLPRRLALPVCAALASASALFSSLLLGLPPLLSAVAALGALAGCAALLGAAPPPPWLLAAAVAGAELSLVALSRKLLWSVHFEFVGLGGAAAGGRIGGTRGPGAGLGGATVSLQQLLVLLLAASLLALCAAACLLLVLASRRASGARAAAAAGCGGGLLSSGGDDGKAQGGGAAVEGLAGGAGASAGALLAGAGGAGLSARAASRAAAASSVFGACCLLHLPLLHASELLLYAQPPAGAFYPPYLVLATSAAGAAAVLAHERATGGGDALGNSRSNGESHGGGGSGARGAPLRARAGVRLTPLGFLLLCGYASKSVVLLPAVAAARSAAAAPCLCLAAVACAYTPLLVEAGEASLPQIRAGALAAFGAAWLARHRALAPLLALVAGAPPAAATPAALALALPALSAAAALRRHAPSGAAGAQRQCLLLLLAALLLWLLQPCLDGPLLARSVLHTLLHPGRAFHPAPAQQPQPQLPWAGQGATAAAAATMLGAGYEGGIDFGGGAPAARLLLWPPWALWLLCVGAAGWLLLAPPSRAPGRHRSPPSLTMAAALGAIGGLYVAGTVRMPPDRLGYALLASAAGVHGALLAAMHGPAPSRRALRLLHCVGLALLAVGAAVGGRSAHVTGREYRATSGGQQSRVAVLALGICAPPRRAPGLAAAACAAGESAAAARCCATLR